MTTAATALLLEKLGFRFGDPELLDLALTHSSLHKSAKGPRGDNERLEFLGDRVLGLVVAEMLYETFPDEPEGTLARRHTSLVRKETLAEVAQELDLGDCIRMTKGEADGGGRSKPSVLADATEALIAAIYLDQGLGTTRNFVRKMLEPFLEKDLTAPKDAKTTLQEWAQSKGYALPVYTQTGRRGPDHAPSFDIEVCVADTYRATASGPSKRLAEQGAAQVLLEQLDTGSIT